MKEGNKGTVKISKIKKLLFPALLSLVLVSAFICTTYILLNQTATKMVVSYINEIAAHDMKNIQDFVSDRWKSMNGVYTVLQERNLQSTEELLDELDYDAMAMRFDHLYLMDDEGNLYSDDKEIINKSKNVFVNYFKNEEEHFVLRYVSDGHFLEPNKEFMLYGINMSKDPIIADNDGKAGKFVGMVMLNDIAKIRERMRISSFGDRGYSSVIDSDGEYIVTDEKTAGNDEYQNFYDILELCQTHGTTADEVKSQISEKKNIDFWVTDTGGVEKFISIRAIENSDWAFIMSVEKSVFTDQINQFIFLTILIICCLLFVLFALFVAVYRSREQLKNIYTSVTKGVYNRQYYDEKLVNAKINALVIIDLDWLKTINDTFGHIAGDVAIKEMADILVKNVGETGEVFRFGGDEFGIAYRNDISAGDFKQTLENILEDVHKLHFADYPDLKITLSVGGYYGAGVTGELLKRADELLYKAKVTRDCVATNVK